MAGADMMAPEGADDDPQPKWFTPGRLLVIFCLTNLMVYLDRGLIASNGVNGSARTAENPSGAGLQGEFNLTLFQDGLLPAAFMVGLLISSPVFAEASKHSNAFRLLAIGMGIWAAACFACGAAPNFAVMIVARMFVGVGEASFVSLAAPFIDDYAPANAKTRWLSAFYLCIPVGFASGFIVGGLVGNQLGWRSGFFIEAAIMVPFVLFAATAQPLRLHGSSTAASKGPPKPLLQLASEFAVDVRVVAARPVWVLVVVGYTFYCAVVGVYSYWGPQAGMALFFGSNSKTDTPDLVFGAVTVLTGVVGAVGGGVLLDKMGASLRNAAVLCACSSGIGCVLMLLTFNLTTTFTSFMVMFGFAELAIFLLQAPVAAVGMWCVPNGLRPLGISLTTCAIHLFGDVPSPPFVGWLQRILTDGKTGQDAAEEWRVSLSIITCLLLVSTLAFAAAAYVATPAHDFRLVAAAGGAAGALGGAESGQLESGSAPLLHAEDRQADGGSNGQGGDGELA